MLLGFTLFLGLLVTLLLHLPPICWGLAILPHWMFPALWLQMHFLSLMFTLWYSLFPHLYLYLLFILLLRLTGCPNRDYICLYIFISIYFYYHAYMHYPCLSLDIGTASPPISKYYMEIYYFLIWPAMSGFCGHRQDFLSSRYRHSQTALMLYNHFLSWMVSTLSMSSHLFRWAVSALNSLYHIEFKLDYILIFTYLL